MRLTPAARPLSRRAIDTPPGLPRRLEQAEAGEAGNGKARTRRRPPARGRVGVSYTLNRVIGGTRLAHVNPYAEGAVLLYRRGRRRLTRKARVKTMGWAAGHIEKLRRGETVSFRPRGHSMSGRIESGQLCTVTPVDPGAVKVGDIVLCKVNGCEYLHLVKAIQGGRFQIGNNRGRINGWVTGGAIYGRCVRVEA